MASFPVELSPLEDAAVTIVGRTYLEQGRAIVVRIQWGLKSQGETYGGPRNVLVERATGELVVRPFRGLRRTAL